MSAGIVEFMFFGWRYQTNSEVVDHRIQIVSIQQRNTFMQKRPPNKIASPNRKVRRIPIPCSNASFFRSSNLRTKDTLLLIVQNRVRVRGDGPDGCCELARCNGWYHGWNVLVLWVIQCFQFRVEEVITVRNRSHHVVRRVSCPDDGDGSSGDNLVIFHSGKKALFS